MTKKEQKRVLNGGRGSGQLYRRLFEYYENKVVNLEAQVDVAKEIIREFVEWANWQGSNCPSFKSIQDKAEQFLNSEVEK